VLPEHTVELLDGEGDHRLRNRPIHLDDLRDDPRLLCLILRARGEQRGLDDQLGTLIELRSMLLRDHVVMAIELADHDVDRTVVFHCLAPVRWGRSARFNLYYHSSLELDICKAKKEAWQ